MSRSGRVRPRSAREYRAEGSETFDVDGFVEQADGDRLVDPAGDPPFRQSPVDIVARDSRRTSTSIRASLGSSPRGRRRAHSRSWWTRLAARRGPAIAGKSNASTRTPPYAAVVADLALSSRRFACMNSGNARRARYGVRSRYGTEPAGRWRGSDQRHPALPKGAGTSRCWPGCRWTCFAGRCRP